MHARIKGLALAAEQRSQETVHLFEALDLFADADPLCLGEGLPHWFRVAVTPKTIMTSLGPVTYRRARYRSGASGASPVPVDESLGLVDDYLTRPAAELGLLMMGHCTAREAAAFFAKTGAMPAGPGSLE